MKAWKIAALVIAALFVYLLVRAWMARPELKDEPTDERPVIALGMPQFLTPERKPGIRAAIDRANLRLTDVRIEVRPYAGNTERIRQKLRLDLAEGNAPDLVLVKGSWISEVLAEGYVHPFEGIDGPTEAEWLPAFYRMRDESGRRVAVPFDADVRVLWYRTDLFADAGLAEPREGWTFEEFLKAAEALTVDTDGDGRIDRWGFGVTMIQAPKAAGHWLPWFFSAGGAVHPSSADGPAVAGPRTLDRFAQMIGRWRVSPPSLVSADQQTIFEGLAGGLYAMTGGGSWEYKLLQAQSPYADRIAAAPFPPDPPAGRSVTVCEGWHWMLATSDPDRARAATRIALFFAEPDAQLPKWQFDGDLPVRADLYDDPGLWTDPVARRFAEAARRAVGPLSTPYLRTPVASAIATALQSVVLGESGPNEAWERVRRAVEVEPADALSETGVPATVAPVEDRSTNEGG